MATEQLANLAVTTLNGAINNSTTSVVVTSATNFSAAGKFRIVVDSEIMLVTGVSGTTFTVTRGAEGTSAAAHSSGAALAQVFTAGAISGNIPFLIGSQVLGSDTATVTFSSIPATWNHLHLFVIGRNNGANISDNFWVQFNSDTGGNYDYELLQASASTPTAANANNQTAVPIGDIAGATSPAGHCGAFDSIIIAYSQTTFFKTVVSNGFVSQGTGAGKQFTERWAGHWRSTAAITRIDLFLPTGNLFLAGSIFSLYGIP